MFTRIGRGALLLVLIGTSVWITTDETRSQTLKSEYKLDSLNVVQSGALIASHSVFPEVPAKFQTRKIKLTAYSSSADETDDTPNITASGTKTRTGVVAANFLPIGTKVKIPSLFGERVFTVEDRMHSRFQDRLDIWFPTKEEAKRFGLKVSEVEIQI